MVIDRIELRHVRLRLKAPFETSFGAKQDIDHVLVRLDSEGLTGWGEAACQATPYYSPDTVETTWHVLRDFVVPAVLGRDLAGPGALPSEVTRIRGHPYAKAALDMALWDLEGKRRGVPVARLLGGTRERVESGVSLGLEAGGIDALRPAIDRFLAEGYRRIKLKIKPGQDEALAAAFRRAYPTTPLMLDANSAYTLADLPLFQRLDAYDLLMIEQPLAHDDLVDHAELQRAIRTPLCLDESVRSAEDGRKALAIGACRIVNIKVGRVGGLSEAKRLHDVCAARGAPVWCGGQHEFGIGRAANVALASLPGFTLPGDISATDRYYVEDIAEPPFVVERGTLAVPSRPGLGVEVVPDRLERATLARLEFRAR
ncbi:MAG TPA: o-succinylbenzoate synthase [Thermodesulfobacteriota bacterium]|nr:o-succinylbenzoate synthase [Thermodesulfobacteriota bacterium]